MTKEAVRESPREIFNWYLIFCTLDVSFSGVSKGFDEGEVLLEILVKDVLLTISQGTSHLSLLCRSS